MHSLPASPSPAVPSSRRHRNLELDWLRAYAVLLVVLFHLSVILAPGPRVFAFFFGFLNLSGGVDLFFAISGFVIASSLDPLWSPLPTTIRPDVVKDFFVRRFWRLWPASTLWITYCLLAAWLFAGTGSWPPVQRVLWQWATAIVPVYELQEFRHPTVLGYYWTLSVEWQFYTVFPFLLWSLRSGRARAAALLALFLFGLWTNEISWMLRFSSIIGGILVYALHRSGRLTAGGPATRYREFRLWLTPILLIVLTTVPQLGHSRLIGQLGLTTLCTLLVAMGAAERELIGDCGIPRALAWVGLRSYSLYLCHIPVALTLLTVLDGRHGNRPDRVGAVSLLLVGSAAVIAVAMAHLSYQYVEIPLQRRFRPRHGRSPD